jgi:hypothetical protein
MNISIVSKTMTTTIGEIAIVRKKTPILSLAHELQNFLYGGDGGDMVA